MSEIGPSLVTGGGGFIGRHLVAQLADLGVRVRVLDPRAKAEDFPDGVEICSGSILDKRDLFGALKDVTHVFHLAANAHLWANDPSIFETVNHKGTVALLQATAGLPIEKIVVTSTETVLRGWRNGNRAPISEKEPTPDERDMAGQYTRSKYRQEMAAREAAAAGQPVVIVYPTVPVGPGDISLTAPTRMILDFLNEKSPAYMETGLNLVPVEDAARGHILAARLGESGSRYILGGENVYLSRLLINLERMSGVHMPTTRIPWWLGYASAWGMELMANHVTHRTPAASVEGLRLALHDSFVDTSLAAREIRFEAGSAVDALLRALRWYEDIGWWGRRTDGRRT